MNIEDYLEDKRRQINAALNKSLPREIDYPPTLCKAMRYGVMGGGKRIRPTLAIAAFEACGGQGDAILPFACALELIHTYSLIHDDLPSMDDDDFRRGQPTVHRIFGEAVAILTGDALLAEAFRAMSRGAAEYGVDAGVALDIIHEISRSVGATGLVGGQVVDIESEGRDVDLPTLGYIHTHKTGALIVASLKTGAKLGGGCSEELEAITGYGERIGLAFQIVDDILDVAGESSRLGKAVGKDEARKKATYPGLVGVEESKNRGRNLVEEAVSYLTIFHEGGEPLREIAFYLIRRTSKLTSCHG